VLFLCAGNSAPSVLAEAILDMRGRADDGEVVGADHPPRNKRADALTRVSGFRVHRASVMHQQNERAVAVVERPEPIGGTGLW
jgi:protein-tyrosine-phosphatase